MDNKTRKKHDELVNKNHDSLLDYSPSDLFDMNEDELDELLLSINPAFLDEIDEYNKINTHNKIAALSAKEIFKLDEKSLDEHLGAIGLLDDVEKYNAKKAQAHDESQPNIYLDQLFKKLKENISLAANYIFKQRNAQIKWAISAFCFIFIFGGGYLNYNNKSPLLTDNRSKVPTKIEVNLKHQKSLPEETSRYKLSTGYMSDIVAIKLSNPTLSNENAHVANDYINTAYTMKWYDATTIKKALTQGVSLASSIKETPVGFSAPSKHQNHLYAIAKLKNQNSIKGELKIQSPPVTAINTNVIGSSSKVITNIGSIKSDIIANKQSIKASLSIDDIILLKENLKRSLWNSIQTNSKISSTNLQEINTSKLRAKLRLSILNNDKNTEHIRYYDINNTFMDTGALAVDLVDGDISNSYNALETLPEGIYILTYVDNKNNFNDTNLKSIGHYINSGIDLGGIKAAALSVDAKSVVSQLDSSMLSKTNVGHNNDTISNLSNGENNFASLAPPKKNLDITMNHTTSIDKRKVTDLTKFSSDGAELIRNKTTNYAARLALPKKNLDIKQRRTGPNDKIEVNDNTTLSSNVAALRLNKKTNNTASVTLPKIYLGIKKSHTAPNNKIKINGLSTLSPNVTDTKLNNTANSFASVAPPKKNLDIKKSHTASIINKRKDTSLAKFSSDGAELIRNKTTIYAASLARPKKTLDIKQHRTAPNNKIKINDLTTLSSNVADIKLNGTANGFANVAPPKKDLDVKKNHTTSIDTGKVTRLAKLSSNGAVIKLNNSTAFTATNADITLSNVTNNFGYLALIGVNATINENSATDLAGATLTGALGLTSAGHITDSGAVAVTGLTTLNNYLGTDIALGHASNDFSTVTIASSGDVVSLTDTDGIILSDMNSASLSISAGGDVTQNGGLIVSGLNQNITLEDVASDFGIITVASTGDTVQLQDVNAITLGVSNANSLTVTAGGNTANSFASVAPPKKNLDIKKSHAATNNFGNLSITSSIANPKEMNTLQDSDILDTVEINGDYIYLIDANDITLNGVAFSNLTIISASNINQSSSVVIDNIATLKMDRHSAITLNGGRNNFGSVRIDADGNIYDAITAANAIIVSDLIKSNKISIIIKQDDNIFNAVSKKFNQNIALAVIDKLGGDSMELRKRVKPNTVLSFTLIKYSDNGIHKGYGEVSDVYLN